MMTLQELNSSLYPKTPAPMPKAQEDIPPSLMKYEVTLKPHDSGEWVIGYVVTHIPLEFWVEAHHYDLVSIGNVCPATIGVDFTDLK